MTYFLWKYIFRYHKNPAEESKRVGGAVLHAVWTAHQLGRSIVV
jgi:hypothetical protein